MTLIIVLLPGQEVTDGRIRPRSCNLKASSSLTRTKMLKFNDLNNMALEMS